MIQDSEEGLGAGGQLRLLPFANILEDFVMLGTTVPEPAAKDPTKDDRMVVCSAGVSELGLTRIHPLDWNNVPNRWHRFAVKVERTNKDSRHESFTPSGDNKNNCCFEHIGKVSQSKRKVLLDPYRIESISEANEQRISLGVLKSLDFKLYLEASSVRPHPMNWFYEYGKPVKSRERYPLMPRMKFTDKDGAHDVMLRDWGVFERMRKVARDHPDFSVADMLEHLLGALSITEQSCFFVGNYLHHRNAWCVISVLNKVV